MSSESTFRLEHQTRIVNWGGACLSYSVDSRREQHLEDENLTQETRDDAMRCV